jgi:hypothetical protein
MMKIIFGISRLMMARRAEISTRRMIGPMTKPINRSMPVHNRPATTWTKFRNHRSRLTMAHTMMASARAHQIRLRHWMRAVGSTVAEAAVGAFSEVALVMARILDAERRATQEPCRLAFCRGADRLSARGEHRWTILLALSCPMGGFRSMGRVMPQARWPG